jgi:hypothetical protein
MAAVAEVPLDQNPGPSGCSLHLDIVVELDAECVHIGQGIGHSLGPVPGVSQVSDAHRPGSPDGRDLDPEAERRSAVMW